MADSVPLIRALRPFPQPVRVETIDGEPWLVAAEPWRVPIPGETYDPLAKKRPRLWQVLAELDADDAGACAAAASQWGFLLRKTQLEVRLGGIDSPQAKTREEYASGTAHQRERVADWKEPLQPFQLAAALLTAWTRGDWSVVQVRVVAVKPPPGWIVIGEAGGVQHPLPEVLQSEPSHERAARLLHSSLVRTGLEEHVTVTDDADEGPRVVARSLLGSAWLSMVADRVGGIRWKACRGCGKPSLILGGDRRAERRAYCGDSCRAAAHKARQRARKKAKKKTTPKKKASRRRAR